MRIICGEPAYARSAQKVSKTMFSTRRGKGSRAKRARKSENYSEHADAPAKKEGLSCYIFAIFFAGGGWLPDPVINIYALAIRDLKK